MMEMKFIPTSRKTKNKHNKMIILYNTANELINKKENLIMTQKNINMMDKVVDELSNGKTISQALKTVYNKRSVAIPFTSIETNVPIDVLHLKSRTFNSLMRAHLKTVDSVIEFVSKHGTSKIQNLGRSSGIELFEAILNYCWDHLNEERKVDFLIDTVERNQYFIRPELA